MLNEVRIIKAAAATGAGITTVNGNTIDLTGFDGVLFVSSIATANAGNYLKAQEGDASNLSDAADLAGTKTAAGTNADVVPLDIKRPGKRYIRAALVRGASTAVGEIWAFLYRKNKVPVNNGQITARTGYIAKQVLSPIAGTV